MASIEKDPQLIESTQIVSDSILRSWLIAGAVLGGLVGLGIFPNDSRRESLLQWGITSSLSFFGTPILIKWRGWDTSDGDIVLGTAGIVAAVCWAVIKGFSKVDFKTIFSNFIKNRINDK